MFSGAYMSDTIVVMKADKESITDKQKDGQTMKK